MQRQASCRVGIGKSSLGCQKRVLNEIRVILARHHDRRAREGTCDVASSDRALGQQIGVSFCADMIRSDDRRMQFKRAQGIE